MTKELQERVENASEGTLEVYDIITNSLMNADPLHERFTVEEVLEGLQLAIDVAKAAKELSNEDSFN